ncbi:MAG TPA: RHS repeat-associated core domain-containing protein [Candidatus Acidoferrales bacterium]|nr:RHS repeat-associated core domain-containing protein [Candidatus Acidoferrales bacterium]
MWLGSIQAGSLPNYIYTLSLGYAGDGSVTSSNDSVDGDMSFTYDNLNRLATMSSPSNPSGCYGLSWSYDGAGNRTAQSVTSGSCPASSLGFNASNQITSPSGFQYDAAGNLANDTAHSYAYDAEGRILTIDGGNGAYVYDAFGRRIEKTTGSTSLVILYDLAGRRIGAVSTSGVDVDHRIYAGSRLVAAYTPGPLGGTTYFYHSDQLGTDRVVTGSAGAVIETCTSLPFGDNHYCTSNVPARFEGYDTDQEYGLAHAPARYYSPSLGRFMTPDPFGTPPEREATCSLGSPPADKMTGPLARPESLNRYAYVVDNPATSADPSGNFIVSEDCFLDSLLPECQCDPENGCPPDLLLLFPPPVPVPQSFSWDCTRQNEKPRFFGLCFYGCTLENRPPGTAAYGEAIFGTVRLSRDCKFSVTTKCPFYVRVQSFGVNDIERGKIVKCQKEPQ